MTIVDRLKIYIEHSGLQITQFADQAVIPRPTLSQILNGRNKKISNELLEKLHTAFPKLNVAWLLFGDGQMEEQSDAAEGSASPTSQRQTPEQPTAQPTRQVAAQQTVAKQNQAAASAAAHTQASSLQQDLFQANPTPDNAEDTRSEGPSQRSPIHQIPVEQGVASPKQVPTISVNPNSRKKIERIIVFYTDQSFEQFNPA